VTLDDDSRDGYHALVAFANGREYGNRLMLAPNGDLRDGYLDAVIVSGGPPWRQLWRARRLFLMPHRPAAGIVRRRVRSASVEAPRLMCHVDGEPFETSGRVDVTIRPGALRVCGLG
jgi:diacylglycerol kinase family enzyme